MDKAQEFIKEHLFTRNFTDPNKPIVEKRLQETLLLLPTDGGASSRLKVAKKKMKVTTDTLQNFVEDPTKHPDYRKINKNSKSALREYIIKCKWATRKALRIAHDQQISGKDSLYKFLTEKEPELWSSLVRYDTFIPMYENLWLAYIREVLSIPTGVQDIAKLHINGSAALIKLSMADYNGAKLRVAKSVNKNLVGIEGIVVWDSQKNFIMVTKGKMADEIKMVPKKGSVFDLEIPINDEDALLYTILGDRFKYRSSDRAGRKFKSRRCDDLLFYVSDTK